jgi:hypothetical protein
MTAEFERTLSEYEQTLKKNQAPLEAGLVS